MNLVTSNTCKLIDILIFILVLSSYDIAKLQVLESNLLHTSITPRLRPKAKFSPCTCTTCALWLNPIRWVIMRVVLYNGIPCVEFHIAVIQVHVITYWFRKRPVSNLFNHWQNTVLSLKFIFDAILSYHFLLSGLDLWEIYCISRTFPSKGNVKSSHLVPITPSKKTKKQKNIQQLVCNKSVLTLHGQFLCLKYDEIIKSCNLRCIQEVWCW